MLSWISILLTVMDKQSPLIWYLSKESQIFQILVPICEIRWKTHLWSFSHEKLAMPIFLDLKTAKSGSKMGQNALKMIKDIYLCWSSVGIQLESFKRSPHAHMESIADVTFSPRPCDQTSLCNQPSSFACSVAMMGRLRTSRIWEVRLIRLKPDSASLSASRSSILRWPYMLWPS